MISGAYFRNLHTAMAQHSNPMLLRVNHDYHTRGKSQISKVYACENSRLYVDLCRFDVSNKHYNCAGSCKGLICFAPQHFELLPIILFNPVTREHIALPVPPRSSSIHVSVAVAFGFSSTTEEYKVFRIYQQEWDFEDPFSVKAVVDVFRFGHGESWQRLPEISYLPDGRSVYINGKIHWMTFTGHSVGIGGKRLILDVCKEEFSLKDDPKLIMYAAMEQGIEVNLFELEGLLGVALHGIFSSNVHIWVMKGEIWEMLYTFTVPSKKEMILLKFQGLSAVWHSDNILVLKFNHCFLMYDTSDIFLRELEYPTLYCGHHRVYPLEFCDGYRPSLLSPNKLGHHRTLPCAFCSPQ